MTESKNKMCKKRSLHIRLSPPRIERPSSVRPALSDDHQSCPAQSRNDLSSNFLPGMGWMVGLFRLIFILIVVVVVISTHRRPFSTSSNSTQLNSTRDEMRNRNIQTRHVLPNSQSSLSPKRHHHLCLSFVRVEKKEGKINQNDKSQQIVAK